MAEEKAPEKNKENEAGEGEASGLGKKKLIILIVLGLVIIGLSVGGTLAVLKFTGGGGADEEAAAEEAVPVEEPIKPAIYYPLKPSIIVNFEARGRQRYLQADITFLTRDTDVIEAIELHMPMIRNALVMLIGGQTYEDVQTAEGKELLRLQCLQTIQGILEKEIGKPGIEQVLFENLVIQ